MCIIQSDKMSVILFLVFVSVAQSLPARDDLRWDLENVDFDTDIVESTVREVRAAAPSKLKDLVNADTKKAFLHKYGNADGDDDEQGYHKRSEDEGAKGYKHFDSFHKKDGDKYGYETHFAYGKANRDDTKAGGHSGKYQEADEGSDEDKQNLKKSDEENAEENVDETKHSYKVVEDIDEDGDSGHYTDGGDGGHAESNTDDSGDSEHHFAEGGDEASDVGHYTDGEHYDEDGDGDSGAYKQTGDAEFDDENSGYTYGSDEAGEQEGDDASEHYTAADEDEDEE